MKKVIFIAFLFCAVLSNAQKATVTLKAGNTIYVTINGQDYPRNGYLSVTYFPNFLNTTDSAFGIIYSNTRTAVVPVTIDTLFIYADSGNKRAYNAPALQAWLRANAY